MKRSRLILLVDRAGLPSGNQARKTSKTVAIYSRPEVLEMISMQQRDRANVKTLINMTRTSAEPSQATTSIESQDRNAAAIIEIDQSM